MHPRHAAIVCATALSLWSIGGIATLGAATVDFAREVRPIFETHCIECHGPEKQKNSLRLDARVYALKGGDEHPQIFVAGKADESALIHLVAGKDPDTVMPPKGERLSAKEIEILRAWINEGAVWPDDGVRIDDPLKTHWAFLPVTSPPVPAMEATAGNPIDAFIAARLAEQGLHTSPRADARTLARRLYLDLTGLPPTNEEVRQFTQALARDEHAAISTLVDRLLDSPRYGERWARHWLDVVRFAESNGFEKNTERPNAWRYRDYVIRALNEDRPFDEFIRDQIAGDTTDEDAATGFLVGGPKDEVKSPDPVLTAQQRADELNDMVATTGTAFLGLTLQCARCHNHKFDPVSQTDYYRLAATFAGVRHGERPLRPADYEQRQAKAAALRKELEPVQKELGEFEPMAHPVSTLVILPGDAEHTEKLMPSKNVPTAYEPGSDQGEADCPGDGKAQPTVADGYWVWLGDNAKGNVFAWAPYAEGKYRVWVSWGSGYRTHDDDARYILDADGDPKTENDQQEIGVADHRKFADVTGTMPSRKLWSGFKDLGVHEFARSSRLLLRVGGKEGFPTADILVLQADEGQSLAPGSAPHLRPPVRRDANIERFAPVKARQARFTILETSQLQPCIDELEIFSAEAHPRNVALASAGAVPSASSTLPGNAIHQLKHLNDGVYGNSNSWISNERGGGWAQIEFAKPETIDRIVWSRDRSETPRYHDRLAVKYRIEVSLDGKIWRTVASHEDRLPYEGKDQRVYHIASNENLPEAQVRRFKSLQDRQKKLVDELAKTDALPMAYSGQLGEPEEIHRLNRGDVTQQRETVEPGVLAGFGAVKPFEKPPGDSERRVMLSDWISSARNPLTARVIVNRLWGWHFGEGIVNTPSDFGLNGGKPSHPELLDWLAAKFMASGWSLKEMHRLICASATYLQSSAPSPAGLAADAQSRLLWRFPPRRLEAEALRDCILAASGKLDLRMGGPGFLLFEPNTNYVRVYAPKKEFGGDDFRRMVYWHKPRMRLDDTFGVFDCPDAGQVQPRRNRSTTPLQALSLLNSPFLMQQSGFLAQRAREQAGSGDPARNVTQVFEIVLQRAPTAEEKRHALKLVNSEGLEALCRAMLSANEFAYVF